VKTFVKLCGLSEVATLAEVPAGGAAGFVINVPASPRSLSPEAAARLVEHVPSEAEAWGVVVDPSPELIHRLFDEVGLDRVQVYGPIPPDLEFLENHHIVPSIPIPPSVEGDALPAIPPAETHPRLHLDAAGQPLPGGSGVRPSWAVCAQLVDRNPGRKFVLAGGLTPENVGEALATVRPWGVDVSTGIERAPGQKDPERMRAFVRAVERFEQEGHA
jgi:phosphoribosylanthranilate isomerase